MNQKEKNLFFQLCAFRKPSEKKLRALLECNGATPEVLGSLFANRMAGVAYNVLKELKLLDLLDREFRNSLSNAELLNEKKNEDFFGCIRFLTTELDACGIPYALLKGAYLCHWYPAGCRTSNDIDVLIAPEDVGRVSAKLKMAGFKQGYLKNGEFVPANRQEIIESKMMRGETVPFIKEVKKPFMKYLEVDLNFSLDYKNSDETILKEMLEHTEVVTVGEEKIRTLSRYDFLLHLCAHLYKEATTVPWIRMKRDMTFYKYCDIYGLLQDYSAKEAGELIAVAKERGLERELAYCLYSIEKFFGPDAVKCRKYIYERDSRDLETVVAPMEKKIYRYKEPDPLKRFFAKDRMKLLREVVE